MNITLHIERLVIDGMSLSACERPLLMSAVAAELTRLLARGGLCDELQSGGAWRSVGTTGIRPASDGSSARLGEQIAAAVYGGIGK